MTNIEFRAEGGSWSRRSGNFYHLLGASTGTRILARRGIVAVHRIGTGDFRLKVFLVEEPDVKFFDGTSMEVWINGHEFVIPYLGDGHFEGVVDGRALHRMITGLSPAEPEALDDDDEGDDDEFLDVCIESRFHRKEGSRFWEGDHERLPKWMKDPWRLRIDPGPNYFNVVIGADLGSHPPPCVRVNDVWCAGPMPLGPNHFWFAFDPVHLAAMTEYGKGEPDEDLALENEPCPPRSMHEVRRVCMAIGTSGKTYVEWRNAARDWQRSFHGLGTAYGQGRYYRDYERSNADRAEHYRRAILSRFNKRPAAYRSYEIGAWVHEVGGYPKKWEDLRKRYAEKSDECRENAVRLEAMGEEVRARNLAAQAVLEKHEARYEDAIRFLYPPR